MNINFTFYLFKHPFLLVRTDLALYSLVLPERQEYYILLFAHKHRLVDAHCYPPQIFKLLSGLILLQQSL